MTLPAREGAVVELCPLSDLPPAQCAHCRGGDTELPSLFFADRTPPRPVSALRIPDAPLTPAATRRTPRRRDYPALCVLGVNCRPANPSRPRATDGRAWVCPECEDRARAALVEAADVWPDLCDAITALPPVVGETRKAKGDPATGIRLNEAASQVKSDLTRHAGWYARVVRQGVGGTPPDLSTPGLLRWLARTGVPFLAAHPDRDTAECFTRDSPELARLARRAAYPAGTRTITIPGLTCAVPGDDGTACGASMSARIRPDATTLPDLVCDADSEHRIPPSVWRRHEWASRHVQAPTRLQ